MDHRTKIAITNAYNQANAVEDYQTKNALLATIQAIEAAATEGKRASFTGSN